MDNYEKFKASFPWGSNVKEALDILYQYSQTDGAHHKAWCLDQIARALLGERYEEFIKIYKNEDDPDEDEHYDWDKGIAP